MVKKTKKKQPVGITKKQAAHSVRDQQARRRVIIGVTIAVIAPSNIASPFSRQMPFNQPVS